MSITIYHNPRCSKSRKTLELLQESGISPTIVEYLNAPPSAATTLRHARLIGITVADLLRRDEAEFKDAADLVRFDSKFLSNKYLPSRVHWESTKGINFSAMSA